MTQISKKAIIDDISILLTKFYKTDETRLDEDYLSYKIDEARAEAIVAKYAQTQEIDPTWKQDLGLVSFNKVNFADRSSVTTCDCPISKAFIPQVLSLSNGSGSQDLGLNYVTSACGTKTYTPFDISKWHLIPSDHVRAKFPYYSRVNNVLYVNKDVPQLRVLAILFNPEDAKISSSLPVASGSIANGTVYIVKFGQVVYNGVTYQPNTTFTGTTGVTAYYTSIGAVYLYSQVREFTDLDAYPVSGDMARQIVLDICTKEFNIERQGIVDVLNDSKDDAHKQ